MIIGIDFDNTIVSYDHLFWKVAREQQLIGDDVPQNKVAVRDDLRARGLEPLWVEMQGYVYGARMSEASCCPDVEPFLDRCVAAGAEIAIISHKTQFPFSGPKYDLRQAARDWLRDQRFFERWLPADRVFFESTKSEKVARVQQQQCDLFIDDLVEIFREPGFPASTKKILYSAPSSNDKLGDIIVLSTWRDIHDHVFTG